MKIRYHGAFRRLEKVDYCINILLILFFVPVAFVGGYAVYDYLQVEFSAARSGHLASIYVSEDEDAEEFEVDFEALKQKNSDVVAWLRVPDTNIDFPVMHAKDNSFYLSHDFEKNFSITGGVFLDYRNSGDFEDAFSIIYGHRMSSGRMFSDVGKFLDKGFFDSHSYALLYTPKQKYVVRFLAFASIYEAERTVYNFNSYGLADIVNTIKRNARQVRSFNLKNDSKYLLLSTCSTEKEENRDVLLAEIIKK